MSPVTNRPPVAELVAEQKKDAVPAAVVPNPPAKIDDRPNNAAPVTVPAERNEAQVAADALVTDVMALIATFYDTRPRLSTWKEPTQDEIKARVGAVLSERQIDPMDFMAVGACVAEIQAEISKERALAGVDRQAGVDKMWGHAVLDAINVVRDNAKANLGFKKTSNKPSVGRRGRPVGSRKNNNPVLIAWAKEHGLVDEKGNGQFILIDRTDSGMYGTLHPLLAREDGRWERLIRQPNGTFQRTGSLESSILYWTDPKTGERPKENARRVMMINMVKPDGATLEIPHLNFTGKAFQTRGDYSQLCKDLHI